MLGVYTCRFPESTCENDNNWDYIVTFKACVIRLVCNQLRVPSVQRCDSGAATIITGKHQEPESHVGPFRSL